MAAADAAATAEAADTGLSDDAGSGADDAGAGATACVGASDGVDGTDVGAIATTGLAEAAVTLAEAVAVGVITGALLVAAPPSEPAVTHDTTRLMDRANAR